MAGGRSTLVLFGQTGTGKTYTIQGALNSLLDRIFQSRKEVSLTCYELAGTRGGREGVFDLLAERKPVKCLTGEDGQVHVRGADIAQCRSREELQAALARAFEWRSSECTERNEASSRSHAIFEIHFASEKSKDGEDPSGDESHGVLRLVDLAGSERNYDTLMHTRSMAERGGHINYSLLMLKECARLMHSNARREASGDETAKLQHVPFRSSRLTHLLQSCFTDASHKTVVIATLSPTPLDVEHSLNSLQHVAMMRAARAWEMDDAPGDHHHQVQPGRMKQRNPSSKSSSSGPIGFNEVGSRGHGLHSKLQDARAGQLKLRAFDMVTAVGGTIQKKYDPSNLKTEAFIDPRWHREMNVQIEDSDLWVLREADNEAVQVLTAWREKQWQARRAHDLVKWDAPTLCSFIKSLNLPGEVRIPSTMTGAQFRRLGRRGVAALCSDGETATALHEALLGERAANDRVARAHADSNARMAALGANKAHVALGAATSPEGTEQEP